MHKQAWVEFQKMFMQWDELFPFLQIWVFQFLFLLHQEVTAFDHKTFLSNN